MKAAIQKYSWATDVASFFLIIFVFTAVLSAPFAHEISGGLKTIAFLMK